MKLEKFKLNNGSTVYRLFGKLSISVFRKTLLIQINDKKNYQQQIDNYYGELINLSKKDSKCNLKN